MTIFRWIMGALTALFAAGALIGFALFVAFDLPLWLDRARRMRTWLYLVALTWFNVEVWGRVVYTIVTWKS